MLRGNLAHTFFNDPFYRPPPARMDDTHRMGLLVDKNDGQAIRRLDRKQNSWRASNQPVANQRMFWHLVHTMNQIGVNLPQRDERPELAFVPGTQLFEKRRPVPLDRRPRIVLSETKVELVLSVDARDTVGAR